MQLKSITKGFTQHHFLKCAFKSSAGFTIVEMLVAVALFSMVMLMAIAAMISMIDANSKARSVKAAVDNLSFATDEMARDIRLGSRYKCGSSSSTMVLDPGGSAQDCTYQNSSGGDYLGFRDRYGNAMFYRFKDSGVSEKCILRKVTNSNLSGAGYPDGDPGSCASPSSGYERITPPDVIINKIRFYVYNAQAAISGPNAAQPTVIISIQGTAGAKASTQTVFSIMTSATQRVPHNAE
jgi:prepilin-type N-terminal cleavage/methylation domain-containing protein